MNYERIYKEFINSRLAHPPPEDTYTETHHIVPRALDGADVVENLVRLLPEDHFFAHLLLAKIHGGSMWTPVHRMLNTPIQTGQKRREAYGWARRAFAKAQSESRKGKTKENDPGMARMAETLRGRTKQTHEYLAKMAETKRGRTKETDPGVAKMAESLKGRTKETHSGVAAQASKISGRTKETHLGVAAQARKMSGLTKNDKEYLSKRSQEYTGRRKEDYEHLQRMAETKSFGTYITPFGMFISAKDAAKKAHARAETIRFYCLNPERVITKTAVTKSKQGHGLLTDNMVGKTFHELGWGFIPKDPEYLIEYQKKINRQQKAKKKKLRLPWTNGMATDETIQWWSQLDEIFTVWRKSKMSPRKLAQEFGGVPGKGPWANMVRRFKEMENSGMSPRDWAEWVEFKEGKYSD